MHRLGRRARRLALVVLLGLTLAGAAGQPSAAAPLSTWALQQYDADLTNVHFANANAGFAVGERGTIMTTENGGQTWSLQKSGTNVFLFDVHALSSTTAVAVGEGGTILRTTDGGGSWSAQSAGTLKTLYGVDFVDSQRGLAVGFGGAVVRTVDGGKTWKAATDTTTTESLTDVDMVTGTEAYAVGGKATILKSSNGGDHWGSLSWRRRAGSAPDLFAVNFANSSTGWAGGKNGTILRIENSGQKITQLATPVSTAINALDAAGTTGLYVAAAGADGTVLYGKGGGATWTNLSSKVGAAGAKADLHGIHVNEAVSPLPPIHAVGKRGAIVKSGPQYNSFTAQVRPAVTGKQLRAVHFSSSQNGWAAGADGTVLKTTNGGQTWEAETDPDLAGHTFNGIGNGLVVGDKGRVFKKTGTAADWFNHSVDNVKNMYAARNAFGWWIVGEAGSVLWSLPGFNFNYVTAGLPSNKKTTTFYEISFVGNSGWIAGAGGTILKSTNTTNVQSNTASWTTQNSTVSYALKGIHFVNPTIGFAVGQNGAVKTTNGGTTWTATATKPTGALEDVHTLNENVAWAVGADGIFKTTDAGGKWPAQLLGYAVNALSFSDASGPSPKGWAVGDNGLIVKHT